MNLDILKDYSEIDKISLLMNLHKDSIKKLLDVGFTFKGKTLSMNYSKVIEMDVQCWNWSKFRLETKKESETKNYIFQIFRREESFQYKARPNDLFFETICDGDLLLYHIETCDNPINTDIIPILIKIENFIKCI